MLARLTLAARAHAAFAERRRLVVPLMGFPGLRLTGCNIKLAQQNYGEHYRVIKALAQRFSPDMMFPLMDLAVEANALGRYTVFPTDDSATVLRGRFTMDELATRRRINIGFDSRLLGYVETVKLMSIGLPDSMLRGAYVTGPYSLAALIMGADEAALATITDPGFRALSDAIYSKELLDDVTSVAGNKAALEHAVRELSVAPRLLPHEIIELAGAAKKASDLAAVMQQESFQVGLYEMESALDRHFQGIKTRAKASRA